MSTETVAALRLIRAQFTIGPRTRKYRAGASRDGVIADLVERMYTSCNYPGYDGPELTAACRLLLPALWSWEKHVEGYRLPGHQVANLRALSPWQWLSLLGDMVDAGVTCVGQAEGYFRTHRTHEVA